ncbi:hypothetical protein PVW46_22235 [Mameliella sp. AT18]|uniref:hypothetical protein n=1 Tax=Mameliella sp. AT18 TaxID=3028385 RepID=UPI0008410912|nr:hypothetical protein [Mameliella sp. AT18]MDD9732625.1 hypothetical protein [Mameliella sp. AT18]ODM46864.1 hypothetical protein A9320_05500 [Ruegeria sp. PBVC088]
MFALARFLIMAAVVLTVVYGSLWFYLRARRRELLETDWAADPAETRSQEDYVRDALEEFDRRRHRTLVLLVYAVPLCLVTLIVYLTNFH